MNTRLYIIVLFFWCIGLHCIAQPKFLQKELDHNGNIAYATLRTDTAPQLVSKGRFFRLFLIALKRYEKVRLLHYFVFPVSVLR